MVVANARDARDHEGTDHHVEHGDQKRRDVGTFLDLLLLGEVLKAENVLGIFLLHAIALVDTHSFTSQSRLLVDLSVLQKLLGGVIIFEALPLEREALKLRGNSLL